MKNIINYLIKKHVLKFLAPIFPLLLYIGLMFLAIFLLFAIMGNQASLGALNAKGELNPEYVKAIEQMQEKIQKEYEILLPKSYIYATDCIVRNNDYENQAKLYVSEDDLIPFLDIDNNTYYKSMTYEEYQNNDTTKNEVKTSFDELEYNEQERKMWYEAKLIYEKMFPETLTNGGSGVGGSDCLQTPLNPTYGITRGYSSDHAGIDFYAISDKTVVAASSGKVVETSKNCNQQGQLGDWCGSPSLPGLGNGVVIESTTESGKVYYSQYAHMESVSVNTGDVVEQGQPLGIQGTSGNSTGQHMHFEINEGAIWTGSATDPTPYFCEPLTF